MTTRRQTRRRWAALFGLVVWALGTLGVPALHQLHHARYGSDHVHPLDGGAAVYDEVDDASQHASFDADLRALDLADVAHAGIVAIDCELAALTMADCDARQPQSFADAALARTHHQRHAPDHGMGSLEHFGVAFLPALAPMVPPPAQPLTALAERPAPTPHQPAFRRLKSARAPPA